MSALNLNALRNSYPRDRQTSATQTQFQNYYDTVLVNSIRSVGKEFNDLHVYETASISPQLLHQ